MNNAWIIPVAIGVVLLIWFLGTYNGLVRLRNYVRESWAQIDTELKRRYDLIPNLVEIVKGYAKHEREVFQLVTEARNRAAASTGSPASQAADENTFVREVRHLFAVAENYPDLKANQNFLHLQKELVNTEDRIQAARRFFNANVRDLNNRVEMFPSSIIAGIFGFKKEEFFEVEEAVVRMAPSVNV